MTAAPATRTDPDLLGGTPVFEGARVPMETLFAHLRRGERVEDFLADFPTVTREQVDVVLDWAGQAAAAGSFPEPILRQRVPTQQVLIPQRVRA